MESLTPAARAVIEAERLRPDPADLPEEQLLARLSATLGFAPPVVLLDGPRVADAAPAATGMLSAVAVRGALVLTGAIVGGVSVFGVMSRSIDKLEGQVQALRSEAEAARVRPTPSVPERVEASVTAAQAPPAAPMVKVRTGTARAKAPSPPDLDSLNDEKVVLERARTALLRKDPEAALVALDEHSRAHPGGRLTEEREALLVQVLVQLNRRTEAIERAAKFREKYPKSLLLPGVDAVLESPP